MLSTCIGPLARNRCACFAKSGTLIFFFKNTKLSVVLCAERRLIVACTVLCLLHAESFSTNTPTIHRFRFPKMRMRSLITSSSQANKCRYTLLKRIKRSPPRWCSGVLRAVFALVSNRLSPVRFFVCSFQIPKKIFIYIFFIRPSLTMCSATLRFADVRPDVIPSYCFCRFPSAVPVIVCSTSSFKSIVCVVMLPFKITS